jgi:hypothetical protein
MTDVESNFAVGDDNMEATLRELVEARGLAWREHDSEVLENFWLKYQAEKEL